MSVSFGININAIAFIIKTFDCYSCANYHLDIHFFFGHYRKINERQKSHFPTLTSTLWITLFLSKRNCYEWPTSWVHIFLLLLIALILWMKLTKYFELNWMKLHTETINEKWMYFKCQTFDTHWMWQSINGWSTDENWKNDEK